MVWGRNVYRGEMVLCFFFFLFFFFFGGGGGGGGRRTKRPGVKIEAKQLGGVEGVGGRGGGGERLGGGTSWEPAKRRF